MNVESNKALVRRFYEEAWDQGRLDIIDELFADDYVRHDLRPADLLPGPAGMRKLTEDFRAAFPDLSFTVRLLVGEGDYVVGRWTATGTHSGRWGGVEPTRRRAELTGVNIFRFENGQTAELWNFRGDRGLMEQLGDRVYAGAAPE